MKNTVTEKLFQSPSKYIQGPSAIKNAPLYLGRLGKTALLIADDLVYKIAGTALTTALEEAKMTVLYARFNGEASVQEITRVQDIGEQGKAEFVIALGGGKTIDTAKAVADKLGVPSAILPTTASTDAPCSALSVLYTPNGEFDQYSFFLANPTVVLVDTSIVANAPARFLSAGMGDALATHVEARETRNSTNFGGGLPTLVSSAITSKCEEILFKYGKLAYEANKVGAITPALEAVVEANTLLSGLGFESGGLAAAHAIHNGLTALEGTHHLMHGEKVNFGTICQLILSNTPHEEMDRYLEFMISVDLPITLEQLGAKDATNEQLKKVAELSCSENETIWNLDRVINVDVVFHTIKGADAIGRSFLKKKGLLA
ncbi:glycerol dehydrogenase [Guyanagaster necrorhizus]|uniref:Glycerol dehydrogenase n=1 Tax=Guyanagaster necrorhizus TaxID=856835 RepID=A0A9P7VUA4_9AGAR|nr:glycerol dehydrogenase [Guyanagaster necrorhizus MCA 3950]KAG7446753.1 glycerol dehydrogenase [Guyanagaster necrorhizus MCA 3950]